MKIPPTTEANPFLTLNCDETDTAEPQQQTAPFPFQSLLSELQQLIIGQFDMPTRWAFRWSCKQYYAVGTEEFDCFAFTDQCAELGYRTLLQYSIERGGPFDFETSKVAARHGRLDILKMYAKKAHKQDLRVKPHEIPDAVRRWSEEAAKAGQSKILDWLQIEHWRDDNILCEGASMAIEHGHLDIAVRLYKKARALIPSCGIGYRMRLLRSACTGGRIEAVERAKQLFGNGERFHWVTFINSCIIQKGHVPLLSWLLQGHPELVTDESKDEMVTTGLKTGNVELLQLAEKYGATITIDHCHPDNLEGRFPPVATLKYLHEKFNLRTAPFNEPYGISIWCSQADVEWMEKLGYQFLFSADIMDWLIKNRKFDLIPWLLQHGIRPKAWDIHQAARLFKVDLLDLLWQAKGDDVLPDSREIAELLDFFIERVAKTRMKPLLKTTHCLLAKGYTFDAASCDRFVRRLLEQKPGLFRAFHDEIMALNMPLSDDTQQRITVFIAKKQ